MTVITPEQFLALPADPDDEDLEVPAAPVDPLESIAGSLRTIVTRMETADAEEREEDHFQELVDQLDRELAEKVALIEKVLEVCKPSTSKLANRVREVLGEGTWHTEPVHAPVADASGEEPTPVDPAPHYNAPADDAPVEVWREYARGRGYGGADVDGMNRSQIRTMLGIPQPVAEVQA